MGFNDFLRQFRDLILNNKLVTFLSVALFAFIITTIALASSNQSTKAAIRQCQAQIAGGPQCSVSIKSDIPEKLCPVYLKLDGSTLKLWAPHGSSLVWNKSEKTALLCSGDNNTLAATHQVLSYKTCIKDTQFSVENKSIKSIDLKCELEVNGDFKATDEECGNGRGKLQRIGFRANETVFITYIEACLKSDKANVLYTSHILPGAAIANAATNVADSTWRKDGMPSNIDTMYDQKYQLERFTEIFEAKAKEFINEKQYLSRGHLTPKGDGIFSSWKSATFFYANAVPQWNEINSGNWEKVESLTRAIAKALLEDVIVIQGTLNELSLLDGNNKSQLILLEDEGTVVPLWLWKIVKSPSRNAGIAFVTLNNPFVEALPDSQLPCANICDQTGWNANVGSEPKKGLTICCDPNMLIRAVSHAPDEGLVRNILNQDILSSAATRLSERLSIVIIVLAVIISTVSLGF